MRLSPRRDKQDWFECLAQGLQVMAYQACYSWFDAALEE